MNQVLVDFQDIEEPSCIVPVSEFMQKILEFKKITDWEVSILFCSDAFIQNLNKEYRAIDAPTDVLSFFMGEWYENEKQKIYRAGDIVISMPALHRNAEEFKVDPDEELKRLLIHGILHLEGMDHETNDPSEPMLIRQEAILREFAGSKLL